MVLLERMLLDEAEACFRRAIRLKPDYPDAHFNLAATLLAKGELQEGWAEYEWRWLTPRMKKTRRDFTQPMWRGEVAEGRTLLIHAEQGFGDCLQFSRYATLAADRGARVVVEVPGPLVRLIRDLPGVDLVVARGDELPPFDIQCPMLSLPMVFGTVLTTIPSPTSYLRAEDAQVAVLETRLAAIGPGPRIGLAWAGNPRKDSPALARRSMPLERFMPVLELPGLRFFSLNKDTPAPPDSPLVDLMDEMADFGDTAALISNLDLVISVDTAVAHLAAALGKPVWLLDRFDTDWRWLAGRRDSPWYPTLRIYRQPRQGDWDSVLDDVRRDLRAMFPEA
jgi:hypothetical protein